MCIAESGPTAMAGSGGITCVLAMAMPLNPTPPKPNLGLPGEVPLNTDALSVGEPLLHTLVTGWVAVWSKDL